MTLVFFSSAPSADRMATRLLDPLHELDDARVDEIFSDNRQATHEATFQAAKTKWMDFPSSGSQSALEKLAHPISVALNPYPPELSFGGYFKVLTERRVAAIMLAIRLYKFDHQDKLPDSLSDLVPRYLRAVPRDPFDPANGPIRYLPKRDPPALYSMGFNGKDDGGSEKFLVFFRGCDHFSWSHAALRASRFQ